DPQAKISAGRWNEQQNAVAADTPIAVTDTGYCARRKRRHQMALFYHQIVVAEAVSFRERDHGL
ncbi:MAG: hypothetical protein AAB289_07085, partial [Chloroflexota bacterium]